MLYNQGYNEYNVKLDKEIISKLKKYKRVANRNKLKPLWIVATLHNQYGSRIKKKIILSTISGEINVKKSVILWFINEKLNEKD